MHLQLDVHGAIGYGKAFHVHAIAEVLVRDLHGPPAAVRDDHHLVQHAAPGNSRHHDRYRLAPVVARQIAP